MKLTESMGGGSQTSNHLATCQQHISSLKSHLPRLQRGLYISQGAENCTIHWCLRKSYKSVNFVWSLVLLKTFKNTPISYQILWHNKIPYRIPDIFDLQVWMELLVLVHPRQHKVATTTVAMEIWPDDLVVSTANHRMVSVISCHWSGDFHHTFLDL